MIRKVFFAYVRFKFKTKDKVGSLNYNNGNVATENDEMCETLNFFCSDAFLPSIEIFPFYDILFTPQERSYQFKNISVE